MAVKIRLKRMGKIRQPYYRVVVVDSRKKRDGKVIEEIGKYHPKLEPSLIEVTSDRAQYWLGVGAQPTEAVEVILKVTGDWQKFKGLPGTEGTLKVAEPKRDKTELFNEALKDAAKEPRTGATTAKRKPAKEAAKQEAPVAPVAAPETPTEAPAEAPPEAAAEAPAEAPAEAVVAPEETPEAVTEAAPEQPAAQESSDESAVSSEAAAEDDVAADAPTEQA